MRQAFAVFLTIYSFGCAARTAEQHYLKARDAFLQQDYATARDEVNAALTADPGNGKYHRLLGGVHLQSGHPLPALAEYEKAIRIDPNDDSAYYNIGLVRDAMGDFAAAEQAYDRSLAIKPDIGTYNNGAWSRLNQKKYPEARADLMKVLAESPDHMNGNINVAHIDIAEGKYGPAADRLTRVLQRYPNNVEALEARAEAYEHLGNLSEATADRNAATVIRKLAPPGS